MTDKIFKCKYCSKEYKSKQLLGAHILHEHKLNKIKCELCNKLCCGNHNYEIHKKIYHTPYNCKVCGKLVVTKYGSGIFCSSNCSNKHIVSEKQKENISIGLKKFYDGKVLKRNNKHKCVDCEKIISRNATRCVKCNSKCRETRNKLSISKKHRTFLTTENDGRLFYGYIYVTENLINKSVYVGQHFTKIHDLKDRYFGSGIHLRRAIQKYGKNNFKKSIIFEGPCTQEQLNELERYYIWLAKNNNDAINCYNIAKGGRGNTKRIYTLVLE